MAYDLAGRQVSISNEIGNVTTNAYDLNGRVVSIIDGTGRVKTMVYDSASNKLNVQYADATILTYAYDSLNRATTMIDWGGTTTYAFDAESRLVGKTEPGNLVQAYAYDPNSNRIKLVDPDGGIFTTVYDALNRTSVVTGADSTVYTMQYDPDNRVTTLTSSALAETLWSYDALSRPITVVESSGPSTPIATTVDAFDPGGRKTSTTRNGIVTTYTNDAINRLLGQNVAGGVATFVYDVLGNTLVKWHQGLPPQTMTYNAASQQLTMTYAAATTGYSYDKAGNTTAETSAGATTGYVYDGENRMTKMTTPAFAVTTFSYAGESPLRRSYQKPGAAVRTMVWDGNHYLGEI